MCIVYSLYVSEVLGSTNVQYLRLNKKWLSKA